MVNLGQKLVGCNTSENIGVIKEVIYKVNQVNRDELQFRVEGLTHWFDLCDTDGVWFFKHDEVKELNNKIRIGDKVKGLKLSGHDLSNEIGVVERIQEEWATVKFSNNIVSYPLYLLIDRDEKNLNIFEKCLNKWDENNKEYDFINPNHYKQGSKEVIEMMQDIWGVEKLIAYCEMNAFKYRMRLGLKPEQSVERDLEKAVWYETKAKELRG